MSSGTAIDQSGKICSDCLVRKPLSSFDMAGYGLQLRPECRDCKRSRSSAQMTSRRAKDGPAPDTKVCAGCGESKPFDLVHFKRCSAKKWGMTGECKPCLRQRERDRIAAKKAGKRRTPVPENLTERVRDPEKTIATRNRWLKSFPEKPRAASSNYRARRLAAAGSHTAEDIQRILSSQRWKCACCRAVLSKYHVDHIKPLSRGGSNYPDNLQILCPSCNCSKSNKDPVTFFQQQGYLL